MVIELTPDDSIWEYTPPEHSYANISFAGASSPNDACLEIWRNDSLIDKVYLRAAHSWWVANNQPFIGQGSSLSDKDTLKLVALNGDIAVRIDLEENAPL